MDTTRPQPATRIALAAFAGAGIVTALAGCAPATSSTGSSTAPESSAPAAAASSTPSTGSSASSGSSASGVVYTDGTYTAEGSYQSPGGKESIQVELTLKGDVVTAVTVTPEATSGNSKQYQGRFASGIADVVVGKKIDELKVDKVSGSSLTSGGFNEALDAIKSQAAG